MDTADPLEPVARAVDAVPGLESLPCDGQGHALEDAVACLHVRCTVTSPAREELLARVAPVVRRARFVMAALVDRRDLYSISYTAGKRGGDVAAAVEKLVGLLRDQEELGSGIVPDRRGR